jgi:hypothetical protein
MTRVNDMQVHGTRVLTWEHGAVHSGLRAILGQLGRHVRKGFVQCRWCRAVVSPLVVRHQGDAVCPNCGSDDWSRPCR